MMDAATEATFNNQGNTGVAETAPAEEAQRETQHESSLDVEQSLPTVAAITGKAERDDVPRQRSRWLIPTLAILVVLLLSLTIGLSVGLKKEEESKENAIQQDNEKDTVSAAQDLSQRYDEIVRFLGDSGVSDLTALEQIGSPQQLAVTYMALLDPVALPVPHSHIIREGYQFVTHYALLVLYMSTNGEEWSKQRHFKSELPTCQWWEVNLDVVTSPLYKYTGVICNDDGIITGLLLPDSKLEGTLPKELGYLTTLKSVVLTSNRLSGSIPATFEQLINLQDLWVSDNQLTGTLPTWIGQFLGLRSLDISENRMAGSLPDELGSLQKLEMAALDNNLFSGGVNMFRKHGGSMRFLYLEGNHFSGPIGDDFMYDKNSNDESPLIALDLSSNTFTGTLPSHIFSSFPNLRVFDANSNMLTGKLPENIKPSEALKFLALHKNSLTGEVSGLLPLLRQLTHLDVSSNGFTGWHIDLGALTGLTYLFLAENPFPAGPFPQFLSTLTNLQDLSLKSTKRTGTIPTFLSRMNDMVLLDLDDNQFTGTIPTELGGLSSLQFALLNRNMLTGTIPAELGNLSFLRMLFLDSNDLTGDVGAICSDDRDPFVVADCAGGGGAQAPVSCLCCDKCCSKGDPCNDETFVPSHDSVWQFGYERSYYWFGGEDYDISKPP